MTTRESMRRELKDLAKLAATMPKERPTPVEAAPSAKPPRPNLQRPPTPSSISLTVPPAVASIPAPGRIVEAGPRKARRGLLGVCVALGLAVAIAGGATLGRTLAHRTAQASAANAPGAPATDPAATAPNGAAAGTPSPAAAGAPTQPPAGAAPVAAVQPAGATTQPTNSGTPASTSAAATPLAAAAPAAAPRPAALRAAAAISKRAPSPSKSSLNAKVTTSGGGAKDPLEEAIRKAVAQGQ
jgi:DNA polymerase-3 subunit gamma/tau